MKKKYNFLIVIGTIGLLFSSCSSVTKVFDSEKKNSSEEFLVEKKSPLNMPPEFNELPIPRSIIEEDQDQEQSEEIKILLTDKNSNQSQLEEIDNTNNDFENLILNKIKNN